jgi:hypothetical protein
VLNESQKCFVAEKFGFSKDQLESGTYKHGKKVCPHFHVKFFSLVREIKSPRDAMFLACPIDPLISVNHFPLADEKYNIMADGRAIFALRCVVCARTGVLCSGSPFEKETPAGFNVERAEYLSVYQKSDR